MIATNYLRHPLLIAVGTFILLLLGWHEPSQAGGGNAWIAPASLVCMVQQPQLEQTAFGKGLLAIPEFKQSLSKGIRVRSCVMDKHILSESLCTALFSKAMESGFDLNALYGQHSSEIQQLGELNVCDKLAE